MWSQAAAQQRDNAGRGHLTSVSRLTPAEAGLLFRGHGERQTANDEGVFLPKSSEVQQCNL